MFVAAQPWLPGLLQRSAGLFRLCGPNLSDWLLTLAGLCQLQPPWSTHSCRVKKIEAAMTHEPSCAVYARGEPCSLVTARPIKVLN